MQRVFCFCCSSGQAVAVCGCGLSGNWWMALLCNVNGHKGTLSYPVSGARLFGLPWPKFLTPKSDTFEYVDDEGRARFDVAISLPFFWPMIRYQGWLESNDAPPIRP